MYSLYAETHIGMQRRGVFTSFALAFRTLSEGYDSKRYKLRAKKLTPHSFRIDAFARYGPFRGKEGKGTRLSKVGTWYIKRDYSSPY